MPLTTHISQSSSRKRNYRIKRADFGNGYSQEAPDGINPTFDEWSVSWENLTSTERNTVVNALDAVQGWDVLLWTAIGDTTQKKFKVADGWTETTTGHLWTISTNLRQTY